MGSDGADSLVTVDVRYPPTNAFLRGVEVDASMTVAEFIENCVQRGLIPTTTRGPHYCIHIDGKCELTRPDATLLSANVVSGDVVDVVPLLRAGGVPGLDMTSIRDLKLDEVPQAGWVFIVRRFEELERRYEEQARQLAMEREKASSRLVATLILLLSQIVLSIGANLLTAGQSVAGLTVLAAGAGQALLATYLSFRRPRG
jgi:hypothetical protein